MLLITFLDDYEAKPPIIVAYLRKPRICNNMNTYGSTNIKTFLKLNKFIYYI
jgi:hypothetical protein